MITNYAARVAALLAGDVQMIETVPTADIAKLSAGERPDSTPCRSRTASSTCTSTATAQGRRRS